MCMSMSVSVCVCACACVRVWCPDFRGCTLLYSIYMYKQGVWDIEVFSFQGVQNKISDSTVPVSSQCHIQSSPESP